MIDSRDLELDNSQLMIDDQAPVVNLTQVGHLPPKHIRRVLAEVALDGNPSLHQYAAGSGHHRLMQNVSKLYLPFIRRAIDPSNELLVVSGTKMALHSAVLSNVHVGDEVIVMEPFNKSYVSLILYAKGIPKFVPLRLKSSSNRTSVTSSDWVTDRSELASVFNSRTKMIILNNPHYPLGKVFSKEELEEIADLCRKHNVLCLSDETFEWMVYEPARHVRIATLPGMWDRTITVCSASQTLLVTGWMVGWAYGTATLISNMKMVYKNSSYTPLQEAIARLLGSEMARTSDHYFASTLRKLLPKRESLSQTLNENGFRATVPDAGYSMVAEWTDIEPTQKKFSEKLAKEAGVVTAPLTGFYSTAHMQLGEDYIVMCFLQKQETLTLTSQRFKQWRCKIDN